MKLESLRSRDREAISHLLSTDRPWSSYALGDLSDLHFGLSRYFVNGPNLALVYEGLQPPALFLLGGVGALRFVCSLLPAGDYNASFIGEPETIFPEGTNVVQLKRMLRMKLELGDRTFDSGVAEELGNKDADAIAALMTHYPENSYNPDQLAYPFAGIYLDDGLVACAGTHVVNPDERVACIGNVVVHPDYRKRGFAQQVVGKVLTLLADQADLATLNVAVKNKEAIELYQGLEFGTHCRFNEAEITLPEPKPE
jgi:ribosomal protein S18 acetylase RimI-like enzyme